MGNTHRNAPWVIQNFYGVAEILTLLMTTAFVNNSAIRDFQHNTHQMIFSLPISKNGLLFGRYLGASLIAVIPSLGVSLGAISLSHTSMCAFSLLTPRGQSRSTSTR